MSGNVDPSGTSVDSLTEVKQSAAGRMVSPTGTQLKSAFPARAPGPTWPSTCLDRAAVLERVSAAPFRLETPRSQRQRETGVLAVLGWLSTFPGETWQQRWEASGAEANSVQLLETSGTLTGRCRPASTFPVATPTGIRSSDAQSHFAARPRITFSVPS